MTWDPDTAPGWPAESTRVVEDPSRLGPLVLGGERRAQQRAAHRRWLERNPAKMREARNRWRAEHRER